MYRYILHVLYATVVACTMRVGVRRVEVVRCRGSPGSLAAVGAMMMTTMSLRLLAGCALLSSVAAYNNGMAKK